MHIAIVYLDDIIVLGNTFEEHLENLQTVQAALRSVNLHLNAEKCNFCKHVVSRRGTYTDPDKVSALYQMSPPNNVKEVRQFIGMASWYRRFIDKFSTIIRPLTKLTHKDVRWSWNEQHMAAYNELKYRLTNAPILACTDFSTTFFLQTDASNEGLGAALFQKPTTAEKVIAYASRGLSETGQKYSVSEKECLVIIWGIRKMRAYLEGYAFVVMADHQALKWLDSIESPCSGANL